MKRSTGLPDSFCRGSSRPTSNDSLFNGELFCCQYQDGYRFSVDSVLLAHFVRSVKNEKILDLCTGCGVVGLILLYRYGGSLTSVTGFELQSGLVELARQNVSRNGFQEQFPVVQGDVCAISESFNAETFSTIVCNPPFYPPGTGRQNKEEEKLIARHQIACTLTDILAAAFVLKNRGRFILIYPAERMSELLKIMQTVRLQSKRMQFIYSSPDSKNSARLVLVEAVKNGGDGVEILPPFYIYESKNGNYSKMMQEMYESNPS